MPETQASTDGGLPYSKGLMAQSLSASGLAPGRAYELALDIERRLAGGGDVEALAEQVLLEEEGEDAVRRYRDWQRIGALDRPLIVLLGGTTGVGKSTLATMLAGRLGVTRVIATDVIRQVLRAFFPEDVMPAVHHSAFEVGDAFGLQAESVAKGVEAIIERACKEGTPMILEGVHLVPGSIDAELRARCVAVEVVIAVEDEELHRSHFHERGPGRPAERYLEGFESIRRLQDSIVASARAQGVAVIDNTSVDHALTDVMRIVLDAAGRALAERGR